ncbi:hypothetical protein ACIBG8_22480 [Nonomuraea sp. NPDC050556]|uniref:hypothetical protein n=1 Tax=Nonomuraea sp. NPDC050556 TaxID=3364369 RepID=UPI003793A6E7
MTETTERSAQGGVVLTVPAPLVRLGLWARHHGVFLTAMLLIALAVAWKAEVVQHSFFKEDDYEFVARAMEGGLSFDYLTRVHFGQFMPISFLLTWVMTRLGPYSWGLAAGSTLVVHALGCLAVYRMLRVIFGRRPATLVPLAVFLFAPLTVPVLVWWAAALNTVFLQVAIPMAVASHWMYLRNRRVRHVLAATFWILVGLLTFVKAFALPLLLFALAVVYFGGLRTALRRYAVAWAAYVVALAGFAVLYVLRSMSVPSTTGVPSIEAAVEFTWALLGRTFATTFVGGPWQWFAGNDWGVTSAPAIAVVISLVVLGAVVLVTSLHRVRALQAWGILLGYLLVADLAPVLWGRVHLVGAFAGTDSRYVADAMPVLALVLGLVLLPLDGEARPYRRKLPSRELVFGASGVVFGGFLAASLASVTIFETHMGADRRYDYLDNARAALAELPAGASVYDRVVPPDVVPSSYGLYSQTSRLLAPLASEKVRAQMYAQPPALRGMVFDDQGKLRDAEIWGERREAPTMDRCWPSLGGQTGVPLFNTAPKREGTLVRIGYSARSDTTVTLWIGDRPTDLALKSGIGKIFLKVPDNLDKVVLAGTGFCAGDVTVGLAVPRP